MSHNLPINKKPKNNKLSKIPKNPNNPNKNSHLPLLPLTNPKTPLLIPPPLTHPLLQNNNKYNQTKSSICNNIHNNKNNSKHINCIKGTISNNQMIMSRMWRMRMIMLTNCWKNRIIYRKLLGIKKWSISDIFIFVWINL